MDQHRRAAPGPCSGRGQADDRQEYGRNNRCADRNQHRRRQRVEPALDGRVPTGMARGGEQHGGKDEWVHSRIILGVCGRPSGGCYARQRYGARAQSRNDAPAHTFGAARWYCLGRATSAPGTCAPRPTPWGSSSMARASATISALPSAMIASACLGVAISPTVRVAIPASRFTLSANWTLVLATRVGRASALMPPEEMQTKSSPAAFSALAK